MEEVIINCPFCNQNVIRCFHKPKTTYFRKARGSATTKMMAFYSEEKYKVLSKECSNCGKPKSEIEKALRSGSAPSKEDVIRRAKASGLPLRF